MLEKISSLKGHTVFCGFGRLAQVAVRELLATGKPVAIIDTDPVKIAEAEELGAHVLHGDATQDEILQKVNIQKASQLVSLLPTDADNLYVILATKEANPELVTITRAEFKQGERRLRRAGASRVISPYVVGGQRVADGLLRPFVMNFLDLTASSSSSDLVIEEIRVTEKSPLVGSTLEKTGVRNQKDVIIAAVITPEGETVFNPEDSLTLEKGSVLIGLGRTADVKAFESKLMPTG